MKFVWFQCESCPFPRFAWLDRDNCQKLYQTFIHNLLHPFEQYEFQKSTEPFFATGKSKSTTYGGQIYWSLLHRLYHIDYVTYTMYPLIATDWDDDPCLSVLYVLVKTVPSVKCSAFLCLPAGFLSFPTKCQPDFMVSNYPII